MCQVERLEGRGADHFLKASGSSQCSVLGNSETEGLPIFVHKTLVGSKLIMRGLRTGTQLITEVL